MKNLSFLLLTFALWACQSTPTDQAVGSSEQVEQGLRPPVLLAGDATWSIDERMKHYGVPGVSIAVINNFEVAWFKTYGVMDIESQQPVTEETLFQAASISKPVAAYGALKLAEMGKLIRGQDVNGQLKSWQIPSNQFTDSVPVVLENLLSHTGGLTVHGFLGYHPGLEVPELTQLLKGANPANSDAIGVDQLPGSQYRYSGGGYCVLQQLVIDQFENRTYPDIMKELVLEPTGMINSTYEQPLPADLLPKAATGYLPDGSQTTGKRHTYPEMAAAGLWTNARDLALFAIDMQKSIQESGGIMSKAMVDDMTNPYFEDFVGLGIFLNNFGDDTYLVHGGWNEGFSSELVFHREKGYGVAVMINSNHPDFISELVRSVAQAYNWDGFLPPLYQAQSLTESDLEAVVGRYFYSEDNTVSIYQQDQQLYLKYLREDPVLLHKIGDNRFIRNHTDTEVLFSPDPQTGLMNIVYIERGSSDEITYEHPKLAEDVLVPYELLMAEDYQGALAAYQELLQSNPDAQDIQEWIINRRGYELMGREQYGLAIELFKINTILYPDAFNTYDSLGEAFYEAGNIDLAIINYKKSLDLNPDNQNAKDMLAKMAESS